MAGEVNRVREHGRGHLYFELVEKGDADQIVGKIEAVAWRNDYLCIRRMLAAHDQEIREGQEIRCRGGVDFYGPFGRLQFVVREVDPVFTLGRLAERRRKTLESLAATGLVERNRQLELPELPLRLALITSEGSAAYHDFLSTLRESGYGFRVLLLDASVQGREAEREVASALGSLPVAGIDCAVLVRGGGARTDLAVFDSRRIAEAVARAPVPVLTGLGHETDRSIADLVAHTALKTPTKAAEFLVERVQEAQQRLAKVQQELTRQASEALRRAREALLRSERGLGLTRYRLSSVSERLKTLAEGLRRASDRRLRERRRRLAELEGRLLVAAPRRLEQDRRRPDRVLERLAAQARSRLREWSVRLGGWERLCLELSPRRTLERGYTITRDAVGQILKRPDQVEAGDRIKTELAGGRLISRVEER